MKPKRELLELVAGSVLEDATFVFTLPLSEPPPVLSVWPAIGVRLSFEGPVKGYCELWTPIEVAQVLAANMMGAEEDSPQAAAMRLDAMKETLNILCGNLLTEMAGTAPVFDLGPPAVADRLRPLPNADGAAEAWLDTDGHPILFRIHVSDTTALAA